MVKLKNTSSSFLFSFIAVLIVHLIILFFFKKDTHHQFSFATPPPSRRINKIDFITKEDLERIKRVGIQRGKKDLEQPDFKREAKPILSLPTPGGMPAPGIVGQKSTAQNSDKNLTSAPPQMYERTRDQTLNEEKVISLSNSHEVLKQDALKSLSLNRQGIAAQKISNFEIRYERPEGVSEDELNSDEKAFYSFYKRSYSSYVSKLYSTYEQIAISRPRINKDFENKHLLVARVDYDENGNIVTVKILKSSESDDIHYFFEETLKKLTLPNPPKIFLKMKKEFSIYYQVQIN